MLVQQASHIPPELARLPQWLPCYPLGWVDPVTQAPINKPKRPMGGPTSTKTQVLQNVLILTSPGQLYGFCFRTTDPYICIDVDHLEDPDVLPPKLLELLQATPTYIEYSISGRGVHIVYALDKAELAHLPAQIKKVQGFEGSIFVRSQFVVITGVRHPLSHSLNVVSRIEPSKIAALVEDDSTPAQKETLAVPALSHMDDEAQKLTLEMVQEWLSRIPTAATPKVKRVYAAFPQLAGEPDDYEHWRIVAAATHHAAALLDQREEGALLFAAWSEQDPHKFVSTEDCAQKYWSNAPHFDSSKSDITFKTLAKLAHAFARITWPQPVFKNGQPTQAPEIGAIVNFIAAVKHYEVKLQQNDVTRQYSVVCANTEIQRIFMYGQAVSSKEFFTTAVLQFAQFAGMHKASMTHARAFANAWVKDHCALISPLRTRILQTPLVPGSLESLLASLTFKIPHGTAEERVRIIHQYRMYIKKSLMGIIRANFYHGNFSSSTSIVILQGPENTYKSTWVRRLMPSDLARDYLCSSQTKISETKELQMEFGRYQIVLLDEVERFLNKDDALLKSLVTQENDMYRPLYASEPVQVPRKCILWGTTNLPYLPITDNGSRRINVVPVLACDTMNPIFDNIMLVYRELYEEFINTPQAQQPGLWALTADEIVQANSLNSGMRLKSDAEVTLEELFDFSTPFDITVFYKAPKKTSGSSRVNTILEHAGYEPKCNPAPIFNRTHPQALNTIGVHRLLQSSAAMRISPSALKHALRRILVPWHDAGNLADSPWPVEHGQVILGPNWKFWLLPPLKAHVLMREESETDSETDSETS